MQQDGKMATSCNTRRSPKHLSTQSFGRPTSSFGIRVATRAEMQQRFLPKVIFAVLLSRVPLADSCGFILLSPTARPAEPNDSG